MVYGTSVIGVLAGERKRALLWTIHFFGLSTCNPHAERFVKTIKYECLNHFILFGERHLRYVVKEFLARYLAERFHQGLGGQLIKAQAGSANDNGTNGAIMRGSRLGVFLNYYHREAA